MAVLRGLPGPRGLRGALNPLASAAMMRRVFTVAAAAVLGLPRWRPPRTPGAAGIGDPYFPLAGNGGYDVAHYDLDLSYQPSTNGCAASPRSRREATQDLSTLQPRPRRARRPLGVRSTAPGALAPRRWRADHHPAARPAQARRLQDRDQSTTACRRRSASSQIGLSGFIHTDDGALVAGPARRRVVLVSGQRPPARQGRVLVRDHRPARAEGDRQRRALSRRRQRLAHDDLEVGGEGADGLLPDDGHDRRVRVDDLPGRRRLLPGRDRSRPAALAGAAHRPALRDLAGRRAVLQAPDAHAERARGRRPGCRSGSSATPSQVGTSSSSRRARSASTTGRRCPTATGTAARPPARGLRGARQRAPVRRALPERLRHGRVRAGGRDRRVERGQRRERGLRTVDGRPGGVRRQAGGAVAHARE